MDYPPFRKIVPENNTINNYIDSVVVALGALFLIHVLYLVIGVKFFQQLGPDASQSPAGRLTVWGVNFYLSMASQLLPVLIWMALYRTMGGPSTPSLGKGEESW